VSVIPVTSPPFTAGAVSLNWTAPSDPASEFQQYNLFISNSLNGTYTQFATVTSLSTTSYTYAAAGADLVPKFFYITTTSTDGSSQPATDTVRTIYLTVTMPAGNGVANLQWTPVSDPLHPSSGVSYAVHREYPAGVYTIIGTTTELKWHDTAAVCDFTYHYYVTIADANSCSSVSNEVSAHLYDITSAAPPSVDSVTVNNTTGQVYMGISPSPSPDATCYVIYKKETFSYVALDTVCGNVPIIYTFSGTDPNAGSVNYYVASIDSCHNSPSVFGFTQNNILLNGSYSLCDTSVLIGWNPYVHMKNGLKTYKVFKSANGGPFTFVGDTTGLAYDITNLQANTNYRFFVRAVDSTGTISSTSNYFSVFTKVQAQPAYIYVKSVSVNMDQNIDVGIFVDDTVFIRSMEVFRSANPTGPFVSIGSIPFLLGNSNYTITDNNVETATTIYYYKARVIDSCYKSSITSNTSKSVLLNVVSNTNRSNSLSWTDYQSYLGNVASWNVYRSVDDVFDPMPIANIPGGVRVYVDNVEPFLPNAGRFNYYVQAVEGPGNPYGLAELSNSNMVETYHSDSIFIPNAFAPKGINRIFLPVTQYVEKTEYRLSIYDRWGEKVWETQDDTQGWDGSGYDVGLYAYVVEWKNAYGEYKRINGTVMMVK
jgi:hypothetical protein